MVGNYPDRTIEKAITHLTDCMTERERRLGPIRIFGEDALYLRKLRGSWPGMHGWDGHAQLVLGLWAGFGPEPDSEQAINLLTPLTNTDGQRGDMARGLLTLLEAGTDQ